MRIFSSIVLGSILGAIAGVVLIGLIGAASGYWFVVEHADDLVYGFESTLAGFVMFAAMLGLPIGAPVGGLLGLVIGAVVGSRASHGGAKAVEHRTGAGQGAAADALREWPDAVRSRGHGRRGKMALAAAAAVLLGLLAAPIASRRRELAQTRAEGDMLGHEVARLGGRPDYGPINVHSLDRMVDLAGTDVTDEGFIGLTRMKGFRLVDVMLLGNTRITDRSIQTLKPGVFRLQTIDLSGTRVTDEALTHLARVGVPLNQLLLARTRITDAGLRAIPDGAVFYNVDLSSTEVTEQGIHDLLQRIDLLGQIRYGDSKNPKQVLGRLGSNHAAPR